MYLNLVYAWCIERVAHDELENWLAELADLLPWQDASTLAAEEAESASFMRMMGKTEG